MFIENSPTPGMYCIDFEGDDHQKVSVILTASCPSGAMLRAWELFPEYRRAARTTRVHHVEYVEMDWQTRQTLMAKGQECQITPTLLDEESRQDLKEGM